MKSTPEQIPLARWVVVHRGEHHFYTTWDDAIRTVCAAAGITTGDVGLITSGASVSVYQGTPASWEWKGTMRKRARREKPVATIYTEHGYNAARSRGDFK